MWCVCVCMYELKCACVEFVLIYSEYCVNVFVCVCVCVCLCVCICIKMYMCLFGYMSLCLCVCVRHRRLQGLHEHTALTPSCVSEATHTMPGDFGASSHNSKCLRERSNPTNNPCGFHSLEDHTAYTIKNKRLAILL